MQKVFYEIGNWVMSHWELVYGFADLVCGSCVWVSSFRNCVTSKDFVCKQLKKTVIVFVQNYNFYLSYCVVLGFSLHITWSFEYVSYRAVGHDWPFPLIKWIKKLSAVCLSLCQRSPCQQRGLRHPEERRWGSRLWTAAHTHTYTHTSPSCENCILIIFGRMDSWIIPHTAGEETSKGVCVRER